MRRTNPRGTRDVDDDAVDGAYGCFRSVQAESIFVTSTPQIIKRRGQ